MISILFILLFFIDPIEEDHAIYLSTIHAELNKGQLQLSVRVFEDDLRDAIRNMAGQVVDPYSPEFVIELERYFKNHLMLKGTKGLLEIALVEHELVGDSYKVELVIERIESSPFLEFEIDYLQELFPAQQNILQLKMSGKQWHHIFKLGKEKWVVPSD